jgi:hypothetical protein
VEFRILVTLCDLKALSNVFEKRRGLAYLKVRNLLQLRKTTQELERISARSNGKHTYNLDKTDGNHSQVRALFPINLAITIVLTEPRRNMLKKIDKIILL